jgi:hypothetical protein
MTMRLLAAGGAAALLLALAPTTDQPAAAAQAKAKAKAKAGTWHTIFDGRSLAGWTPKITGEVAGADPLRTFRVANGAIRVSYDGYDKFAGRFGHLAYKLPVSSYRLRLEYRFYGNYLPDVEGWQHANSGIMFHGQAPQTMTRDQKFPVSLEFQLNGADGDKPRPSGSLCTPGTNVVMAGKLETQHCIRSSGPTLPNGRWVQAELEVRDGIATHKINGVPVLSYGGLQFDPTDADAKPLIERAGGALGISGGYFYLQSEGHPIEFRKIELMILN